MEITPDSIIYARWGTANLNATLVFTWATMALIAGFSWSVTRRLTSQPDMPNARTCLNSGGRPAWPDSRRHQAGTRTIPAATGTLFIFILVSNLLSAVPGFQPPTGSLSTTTALALIVFLAVPFYASGNTGWATI